MSSLNPIDNELVEDVYKACIAGLLERELRAKYRLQSLPVVMLTMATELHSTPDNAWAFKQVVLFDVVDIGYVTAKDRFIMSLHDKQVIMSWVKERCTYLNERVGKIMYNDFLYYGKPYIETLQTLLLEMRNN